MGYEGINSGNIVSGFLKGYMTSKQNKLLREREKEKSALDKKKLDLDIKNAEMKQREDESKLNIIDQLFNMKMTENNVESLPKGQPPGSDFGGLEFGSSFNKSTGGGNKVLEALSDPSKVGALKMAGVDLTGVANLMQNQSQDEYTRERNARLDKQVNYVEGVVNGRPARIAIDKWGNETGQYIMQPVQPVTRKEVLPDGREIEYEIDPYGSRSVGGQTNKPSLNLNGIDLPPGARVISAKPPLSADNAGKLQLAQGALDDLKVAESKLINPDGSINRGILMNTWMPGIISNKLGLPNGQMYKNLYLSPIVSYLRTTTGAAYTNFEQKDAVSMFMPNFKDSDEEVRYKLMRTKQFLGGTIEKVDPNKRYDITVTSDSGQKYGSKFAPIITTQDDFDKLRKGDKYINGVVGDFYGQMRIK